MSTQRSLSLASMSLLLVASVHAQDTPAVSRMGGTDAVASLQAEPIDALVFVGSGRVNGWETFFSAANTGADELDVLAGVSLRFPGGCSLSGCPGYASAFLDGFATFETETLGRDGLDAMYFWNGNGDTLPLVTGYTVNHANQGQIAEVPGVRLSTIISRSSAPLSFANARGADYRSNLVLANVHTFDPEPPRGGEIVIRIEAFSQSGALLGSMSDSIPVGHSKMYQNIYGTLGGHTAAAGQIRVTRTGGDRPFWGVMYTIDRNGAIKASMPVNP